jgi:hypothetical protein
MMDMETVSPRTCTTCKGSGVMYLGYGGEYDTQPCECQYQENTNAKI